MYVCMYVCVRVGVGVYMCVFVCTYVCIYLYEYTYICVKVFILSIYNRIFEIHIVICILWPDTSVARSSVAFKYRNANKTVNNVFSFFFLFYKTFYLFPLL